RDVGLQMIRDGVAWFERSYESELTEAERQVYANSEQLARNEHRGIWQDPSPVAPWEWRKLNAAGPNKGTLSYSAAGKSVTTDKTAPVKTDGSYAKSSSHKTETPKWPLFSPSGNLFSVHMPSNGHDFAVEVEVEGGRSIKANFYWVNHLRITYLVMWASGPYLNQTLPKLFDRTVEALDDVYAAHRLPCEFVQEKDVAMSGYTGRRFKVKDCYLNGAIRNYFKIEGKTLKVFFVAAISEIPDDPATKEFLDSFVINN
ncbi:MAG TPA: thermonuclease family protein, partial [Pyrinomonadaceae bacterium]|nr:thermonuclease family protein [Pyrinomonadaceae bacterium]